MRNGNITSTCQENIARTISLKTVKASKENPNGTPPPGDKTLGFGPAICFYEIKYGYKTEEVEES